MFASLVSAAILVLGTLFQDRGELICYLPGGQVVEASRGQCKKLGGSTVAPTPTPTLIPTPTIAPTVTPAPTSTPTPTPTLTPSPFPRIDSVNLRMCTAGTSCYGWVLGVDVTGSGFAADTQVKLHHVTLSGLDYYGSYQSGDGSTRILTDFYGLPRCEHFDVIAFGSTGTTTAQNTIVSYCP